MKHKLFLLLVILGGFLMTSHAQEIMNKPEKYLAPIAGVDMPYPGDSLSDIPWFVFSDRANNPIYNSSNGSAQAGYANFQQEFAVLQLSADGKRLALANKSDISNNRLEAGKNMVGWMDADRLLLWNKCLQSDDEFRVDKKAMILFVFDEDTKMENGKFVTDVRIYNGPGTSGFEKLKDHSGIFQFFPIYKEENGYVLLGKNSRINSSNPESQLEGWVKKSKLSEWSHRVAWEKNWHKPAVEERKKNLMVDELRSGIMVLGDEEDARTYAQLDRKKSQFRPKSQNKYEEVIFNQSRQPGPMGRFPILDIKDVRSVNDKKTAHPVKVGVIGDLKNYKGDEVDYTGIIEATENLVNLRKINIILAVDATQSIIPYKESIKTGIENAMTQINAMFANASEKDKNNFSFGCVLYRDWAMKDSVQKSSEGLSTDIQALFTFLDENMTMGKNAYKQGVTTDDMEEAMYYGMAYALDKISPNLGESNYMILIGDCGDHQDSTTARKSMFIDMNEVVEILGDYQANLMAFQANNGNNPAYDLFQEQVKQILEQHGESKLVNTTKNHFELPKDAKANGKLIVADKGASIKPEQMTNEITETIEQINKDVNTQVRALTKILVGEAVEESDVDPWIIASAVEYLAKNANMNNEEARAALKGMNQEYKEGYTVIQSEGYTYPYFETVVLFEQKELEDLISAFKDLSVAKKYPSSIQRERLKDALETWFPYYFSGMPLDEIRNKNVGELLKRITGLEFDTIYQNITIAKITTKEVKTPEIKMFVDDIDNKLGALEQVYNRRERYEARVINAEVDDLFLYLPSNLFKNN